MPTIAINGHIYWVVADFIRTSLRQCRGETVVVIEQDAEFLTIRVQEVSGSYAYVKQFDNPKPNTAVETATFQR